MEQFPKRFSGKIWSLIAKKKEIFLVTMLFRKRRKRAAVAAKLTVRVYAYMRSKRLRVPILPFSSPFVSQITDH